MKIRSLQLKNIGVFEDETIAFPENKGNGAEIHILTGQNGTGKTTILQALAVVLLEIEPLTRWFDNELKSDFQKLIFKKSTTKSNIYENNIDVKFVNKDEKYFVQYSKADFFVIPANSRSSNIKIPDYIMTILRDTTIRSSIDTERAEKLIRDHRKKVGIDFCAFAYSGNRFIEHEENINIKEQEDYDPLENALAFDKKYGKDDYSINQWLANTISKRNNAFFEGNHNEIEKYSKSIDFLKKVVSDIVEIPIDFKFKNEKAKIVAIKQGQELDFDLLPDGLRSIISWLGDLIMRMDAIKWENDLDIKDREFILFLDEIEVHLHPYWQRKILPVIQKEFGNA